MKLKYLHVDVFTATPLLGNGLILFYDYPFNLADELLLRITQEMRQFESIFLHKITDDTYSARIFTMEEELDFAGHPILGAAAGLHHLFKTNDKAMQWHIQLKQREIIVDTIMNENSYYATMNQGIPEFVYTPSPTECNEILQSLNLKFNDLYPGLPMEVISTGLPYLIVPLVSGIEHGKILNKKFELLLQSMCAKFIYLLDVSRQEGRTWDNAGLIEDIATGSAAGPAGAYFYRHNLGNKKDDIMIEQGRFLNRPSQMKVSIKSDGNRIADIKVSGDVAIFAQGEIFLKGHFYI